MSKLKILILMGFFASIFGMEAQTNSNIKVLNFNEFKEQIDSKKVVLIDVRTPKEYQDGNIKNSVNFDFLDPQFITCFQELDKDEPIYLYCQSGNRSGKASKKLSELGFTKIYDLQGGYAAWKNASK